MKNENEKKEQPRCASSNDLLVQSDELERTWQRFTQCG